MDSVDEIIEEIKALPFISERLLLLRQNLRLFLLSPAEQFDTSTDWTFRLLQSQVLMDQVSNGNASSNWKKTSTKLQRQLLSAINPRTKGGVNLRLLPENPSSCLTHSTFLLIKGNNESKFEINRIFDCFKRALSYKSDKATRLGEEFNKVVWQSMRQDVTLLLNKSTAEVSRMPLFFVGAKYDPDAYSVYDSEISFLPDVSGRSYWEKWFEGKISGNNIKSKLANRVANLAQSPTINAENVDHLNKAMELLELQDSLLEEIKTAKAELHALSADSSSRGRLHNNPPEPLADLVLPQEAELLKISGQLDELEREASKQQPDKRRMQRTLQAITKIHQVAADSVRRAGSLVSAGFWTAAGGGLALWISQSATLQNIVNYASEIIKRFSH